MVGLGFLQSVSHIKPILTHEKLFAVGKSGPNATLSLIFLGLGWPWVGEFDCFLILFTRYTFPNPTEFVNRKEPVVSYHGSYLIDNLVNRKHPRIVDWVGLSAFSTTPKYNYLLD